MNDCKNCGTAFEGKFCPNCSQKASTHRLTLSHFAHEATHAVTHTDKGILLLIKEMFVRPGVVGREYMEGKRKKYFNPITFLLILMAIQVFAIKKTNVYGSFTQQMEQTFQGFTKADPKKLDDFRKQMKHADKQASVVTDNNKIVMVIFVPFLSLLTWLFFKGSKFNYTENLVFNILVNAQLIVFFLLLCVLPFVINSKLVIAAMYLYIVVSWIYSIIAYKQFYQQGWGKTLWKGLTVQLLYILIMTYASSFIMPYLD